MTSTTPHYFEGPEKTLEIDWVPSVGHSTSGLRAITREQWEHLLTLAQCCILSTISNEHLDSYVLSESSLFVYTHKMVIKTCGTTTLLRLLPSLLELTVSLGMKLEWLGYMRKNFSFPRNQPTFRVCGRTSIFRNTVPFGRGSIRLGAIECGPLECICVR